MPRPLIVSAAIALIAAAAAPAIAADKITRETVVVDQDKRPYYLFIPEPRRPSMPAAFSAPAVSSC